MAPEILQYVGQEACTEKVSKYTCACSYDRFLLAVQVKELRYYLSLPLLSKVDVFSFGMFMYELITLSFPFEQQNLMHNQIERLVVEGERPPLQTRVSRTFAITYARPFINRPHTLLFVCCFHGDRS